MFCGEASMFSAWNGTWQGEIASSAFSFAR